MKDTIKKLIVPFLLLIANISIYFYYKNGLTEYSSVLDRYLNFFSIYSIIIGAAIALISAWICVAFLAVRIIRIKKDTSKVFPSIMITAFIVLNIACLISAGALHSKTNVVNNVSNQSYSYVDFDTLFDGRDESTYQEQTVFYAITDEIPANYSIQQSDSKGGVQTKCVTIANNDLLELYYDELADKYADYGITDFDSNEAEVLGINKGFRYTIDNFEQCIVVVKGDAVFEITVDNRIEIDDAIVQQIRSL